MVLQARLYLSNLAAVAMVATSSNSYLQEHARRRSASTRTGANPLAVPRGEYVAFLESQLDAVISLNPKP